LALCSLNRSLEDEKDYVLFLPCKRPEVERRAFDDKSDVEFGGIKKKDIFFLKWGGKKVDTVVDS
jgi:hypothetical protein